MLQIVLHLPRAHQVLAPCAAKVQAFTTRQAAKLAARMRRPHVRTTPEAARRVGGLFETLAHELHVEEELLQTRVVCIEVVERET